MSRSVPKIKKKNKSSGALRQRRHYSNNKAQNWLEAQDMAELKYRFFRELEKDGTYTYATIQEFADTVSSEQKNPDIKRWLRKAIDIVPHKAIIHQGDWGKERHFDEGKFDESAKSIRKKIKQELNLLGAGMDIACSYTHWQTRIDRISQEVEQYFGGKALLERPSRHMSHKEKKSWERQQKNRLSSYLSTLNRVLNLKMTADKMMLEAMGWNRPQLLALINQSSNGKDIPGNDKAIAASRVQALFQEVIQMQIAKADMYEMELPEDLAGLKSGLDEESRRVEKARLVSGKVN